ncbi:hypothetical protein ROJ8625_00931 [Roseivivax jejudonensis]|uniref:Uncharacterized protein n=1 Tax=Roseivivax jejudonensis TaxID=1529041 RepID=A0A1X6YK61_9RHOB|nr:hypothetical protein [Roseivivax jejudonensis]SLN23268.1 hypothetical protein ROJ8625_00931 [Roseivivax jejudonensis]
MSRLSQRIDRLETTRGAVTVVGVAPDQWPEGQRKAAVERLARARGITGDIDVLAIGQRWPAITEATILHVGDFGEVLDHVAKHGRRIGERRAA